MVFPLISLGSSKVTTEVVTTILKLSYLETLVIANELAAITDVQTGTTTLANQSVGKLFKASVFKSIASSEVSSGIKIKEQWFQPYFDRARYAIGIRELEISRFLYKEKSELISVPYASPKEVIKVNLITDEFIPLAFDNNLQWIKYYIKPEGDKLWTEISPINKSTRFNELGEIVPKIINFNLPKPTTASLEDKYQYTNTPVKQMRFRAVLSRPSGEEFKAMSPLLKSYKLLFTPRQE